MKIKKYILALAILFGQIGYAQQYSSLITDKEIYDFLNWITRSEVDYSDDFFVKPKEIYYKISPWTSTNFGRSEIKNSALDINILYFIPVNDTIFSKSENDFLLQQFYSIKDSIWHKKFKRSRLKQSDQNKFNSKLYEYSLPLFSRDRKYVLVRKIDNCGSLCSSWGYYIYKRVDKFNWKLVTCIYGGIS